MSKIKLIARKFNISENNIRSQISKRKISLDQFENDLDNRLIIIDKTKQLLINKRPIDILHFFASRSASISFMKRLFEIKNNELVNIKLIKSCEKILKGLKNV